MTKEIEIDARAVYQLVGEWPIGADSLRSYLNHPKIKDYIQDRLDVDERPN